MNPARFLVLLSSLLVSPIACQSKASTNEPPSEAPAGAAGSAPTPSGGGGGSGVIEGGATGAGAPGAGAGVAGNLSPAAGSSGASASGAGSSGAGPISDAGPESDAAPPIEAGWTFAWSDEFNGPNVDESVWTIVDTPGTKANGELQYYTPRKNAEPGANVFIENGALVIEAREEAMNGYKYTSARLNTLKSSTALFKYGRMEAKIKLPNVAGMWPAFWMEGQNEAAVGWPIGGEIDIMEGKGRLPNWMSGALHRSLTKGASGDIVSSQSYQLPTGNFHDDWHVFSVEWDETQIRWYADAALFQTVSKPTNAAQPWPFDQPFYFLLNLAVGGMFDNNVTPPAGMAPQRFYVDYVRVFHEAT